MRSTVTSAPLPIVPVGLIRREISMSGSFRMAARVTGSCQLVATPISPVTGSTLSDSNCWWLSEIWNASPAGSSTT